MGSSYAPTWGSSAVLLRCRAVILRCRAQRVSARYINNGRSPQNCIERSCVSAKLSDAILRDDELIGCDCKKNGQPKLSVKVGDCIEISNPFLKDFEVVILFVEWIGNPLPLTKGGDIGEGM